MSSSQPNNTPQSTTPSTPPSTQQVKATLKHPFKTLQWRPKNSKAIINLPVIHGHITLKSLLQHRLATPGYLKKRMATGALMHSEAPIQEMVQIGTMSNALNNKTNSTCNKWVQVSMGSEKFTQKSYKLNKSTQYSGASTPTTTRDLC